MATGKGRGGGKGPGRGQLLDLLHIKITELYGRSFFFKVVFHSVYFVVFGPIK